MEQQNTTFETNLTILQKDSIHVSAPPSTAITASSVALDSLVSSIRVLLSGMQGFTNISFIGEPSRKKGNCF